MDGPHGGGWERGALVISSAARRSTLALARRRHPEALVIAADGGLAVAVELGVCVDVVVGDLDSVDSGQLADAESHGTTIERHPREKDATDLDLAVQYGVARGAPCLAIVDSTVGRLDHFLGAMSLLAQDALADIEVTAYVDDAVVLVVRGGTPPRPVPAAVGATVTLLPPHGDAVGVTTEGLQYPLQGETLPPGSTRGVSNVVVERGARVSLAAGVLLVIMPDATALVEGGAR